METASADLEPGSIASSEEVIPDPDDGACDEDDAGNELDTTPGEPDETRRWKRIPLHRIALLAATSLVLVLGASAAWIGLNVYQADQVTRQQARFVGAAQRGALNLTTIDYQHADADVQRILDGSTGTFHDEFARQSADFVSAVKKAKSQSRGSIAVAGLESASGDQAQVLVAVNVVVSDITAAEQQPRSWRMRVTVNEIGNDIKVSNVEFVP